MTAPGLGLVALVAVLVAPFVVALVLEAIDPQR